MATHKGGLGRGISALIPTSSEMRDTSQRERPADLFFQGATGESPDLRQVPGVVLANIDPTEIVPNAQQPRKTFDADDLAELVHSVKEFGILQPIVVRRRSAGGFELIMGERRWRASQQAGLTTIPAIIKDTSDDAMLRDALLENLHRSQLNALEEASAYQQLLEDFGITQEELATRLGRSRPRVSNTLRLLRLPEAVQSKVAAGVLSAGHARAILAAGSPEAMKKLANRIVNEELSVREAEALASGTSRASSRKPAPQAGGRHGQLDEVAERLADKLNTKVRITLARKKGQLVIDFATIGDLNRILSELGVSNFGEE